MTIFNLVTFPNVCRACLQPTPSEEMVALDRSIDREEFQESIGAFLQQITFTIPPELDRYLPTSVCIECMEVMEFFFKYRRKMMYLHEFMAALVAVKLGDKTRMVDLFESRVEQLNILLSDLGLCNKENASVDDLLAEFDQYMLAAVPVDDDCYQPEGGEESLVPVAKVDKILQIEINEKGFHRTTSQTEEDSDTLVLGEEYEDEENEPSDAACSESQLSDEQDQVDHFRRNRSKRTRTSLQADRLHCDKCSYKTRFTVAFQLHCEKHKRNESNPSGGYECPFPYCLQWFRTMLQFAQHKKKNNHNLFVCEFCGVQLTRRATYDVHLERHSGMTQLTCRYCSSSFHTQTERNNHERSIHLNLDREQCDQCAACFSSKKLLQQHLFSHGSERKYQCDQCERAFKTANHRYRHVKMVHEGTRLSCEYCGKQYGRKDRMRLHIEKKHMIQTYFVCDICVRSFETDEALQEHREYHANPKHLECGVCLVAFVSPEEYDNHVCITYQDNYECCGRTFQHHRLFNTHMERVHGVKVNARVKPKPNLLTGQERAIRIANKKSLPSCTMCGHVDRTEAEKKQHICYVEEYCTPEMSREFSPDHR
ncbi:zinc finger and BTB domain-containing protein 41 [Anopheles cruzii]|uniref:zinc finger and BTB domain-containing protein 41 n=1 Tax=Anopheles cruzii TaxID=68878 RepID=UPI0022EC24F1|nr:zinc finger and BTB domain-containing protein 41 [Anopheles cruzii]